MGISIKDHNEVIVNGIICRIMPDGTYEHLTYQELAERISELQLKISALMFELDECNSKSNYNYTK